MADTEKSSGLSSPPPSAPQDRAPTDPAPGAKSDPSTSTKDTQDGGHRPAVISPLPDAKPATPSARPQLVQLGSNSNHNSNSAPHPKRFSTVNVNKKFLEKNSSASGPTPIAQGSAANKPSGQAARPQTQPVSSFSRLVTAKLTSTSPASSGSAAGWSRPSSVAPSNATGSHSPSNNSPTLPTPASGSPSNLPGAPQPSHAPKVIHPQPRTVGTAQGASSNDSAGDPSNKPVWGNIKQTPSTKRPDVQRDFPTAAEVAQGITSKPVNPRENMDSAALVKQAEADTFRGVHLDPNAHHWDEMEEDDDNFLDGVIEFGDGRQYKIETTDIIESSPPLEPSQPKSSTASEHAPAAVSKQERFVDDFDRTWPRSATSPSAARDLPLPPPGPTAGQGPRGSQESSSRVLFNDRLNRLEPYSGTQRSTTGQHRDHLGTQPPHNNNVQVLHKPSGSDQPSRFRRFSGASSTSHGNREREPPNRWDGIPTSPKDTFAPSPRDRDFGHERGRRSDMGPPALPAHSMRGHSRDGGRQAPPHIPVSPTSAGRPSPREPRLQLHMTPTINSARLPPASPALSQASLARVSPVVPSSPLPPVLSVPEMNEVQKDFMQSAAARAKQRRQQEEEERDKEKERARRKAAELEQRLKPAQAQEAPTKPISPNDAAVIAVIEDAIKSVQSVEAPSVATPPALQPHVPAMQRGSSMRGSTRNFVPDSSRRQSVSSISPTPPVQADSWRSKAGPLSPPPLSKPAVTLIPSQPSALDHVGKLVDGPQEDLEVVEFSDMGKFVGFSEDQPAINALLSETTLPKDSASPSNAIWRQNHLTSAQVENVQVSKSDVHLVKEQSRDDSGSHVPDLSMSTSKESINSALAPSYSGHLKPSRNHKEPGIQALDDAMSRIRGAIDGMQAAETMKDASSVPTSDPEAPTTKVIPVQPVGRTTSTKERWIPPALRLRNFNREFGETDVTGIDPPRSPKPASEFVVRLPTSSRSLEPVNRKQLYNFMRPPPQARPDILSFDPMNRRDFSFSDSLFGKPLGGPRGKTKYRVFLPRTRTFVRTNTATHLPKTTTSGAFGRSTGADGVATWRKATPTKPESVARVESENDQNTPSPPSEESRSGSNDLLMSTDDVTSQSKSDGSHARPRIQPKMPVGSSVAFYRDSKIDSIANESKSSVTFIVTSELEANEESAVTATPLLSFESSSRQNVPSTPASNPAEGTPSSTHSKAESKNSDDSTDLLPVTPPTHHNTPWGKSAFGVSVKESPVRAPDPEHLKAVWSQTSNKAGLHSVNSLEAIADDLTAIPFTIQEVKSEDGGTPPPSISAAPSRMSLHEVTKAFQQVPTPSSSSPAPHRTPPVATPQVARPPNYAYANMRPTYPYPMMNHPHAPNPMYPPPVPPSPIPSRMTVNGHAPLYNQPMWVPAPTPQGHSNIMRPMASPYPAQLVPYPAPGTPNMYTHGPQPPANMQGPSHQQTSGQVNRDRTVPMMSPAMSHAGPAMYGSPVLMHAHAHPPVMQVPQGHAYMVPTGRPVRTDNGQLGTQHPQQPTNHDPAAYNSVAPFMRSTW